MQIFKTMVSLAGDGKIYKCDTIQYEGKFWLVPRWIDMPGTGKTMPSRIILLDDLKHQKLTAPNRIADFVLEDPIPKYVLYGQIPLEEVNKYVVKEKPHIYQGSDSVH